MINNSTELKDFVLTSSQKHKNIINWGSITFLERGIINSEMLAIIGVIKELQISTIIESGRCNGYSTMIMGLALPNIPIISIELVRDSIAKQTEKNLQQFKNITLLYGDSNKIIPSVVNSTPKQSIAILLDGPKGEPAFKLFKKVSNHFTNIQVGFFHDCRRKFEPADNPSRKTIGKYFNCLFFTDDDDYVQQFKDIDSNCITHRGKIMTNHSWRPYHKGDTTFPSYGPTLAITIPERK